MPVGLFLHCIGTLQRYKEQTEPLSLSPSVIFIAIVLYTQEPHIYKKIFLSNDGLFDKNRASWASWQRSRNS